MDGRELQQFERALAARVRTAGPQAIAESTDLISSLSESPAIIAQLQAELGLLQEGGSLADSRWNGRELVLSACPDWSLAVALYPSGVSDVIHSLPNIGCFCLLRGEASIERWALPAGFDVRHFDATRQLGTARAEPLAEHSAVVVDGRREALRILVHRPSVILRLFSSYLCDFQWQFGASDGMARSIAIARPQDTELESMVLMLGAMGGNGAAGLMQRLCSHRNHTVRWRALQNLARLDLSAAVGQLHIAQSDEHPEIRDAASATLGRLSAAGVA